jgi:hypothetical protein
MDGESARSFCERWLPAWTGNRPDELIKTYATDAIYRDPARPAGLRGHAEILPYFRKLLARNPDWVWTAEEIFPTEMGFCFKWRARIPVPGKKAVTVTGMDIVDIRDGEITRNEVYFDPTALLS